MAVPVTSWTQAGNVLIRVAQRIVAPQVCLIDVTPTEDNNADLERVREFLSTMGVIGKAGEGSLREEIRVDEVMQILQTMVAFPVESKHGLRADQDLAYDLYKTVGSKDGEVCPICTEPLVSTFFNPIVMAHCQAFDTPGAHLFHRRCLKDWMQQKVTCPVCRDDLWESLYGRVRRLVLERLWSIGDITARTAIHLAGLCVPAVTAFTAGIIIAANGSETLHEYHHILFVFVLYVLVAANECMMELLWRDKQP